MKCLQPDSSRFWPADTYQPGKAQDSYDKQYVRDYLERNSLEQTTARRLPFPRKLRCGRVKSTSGRIVS